MADIAFTAADIRPLPGAIIENPVVFGTVYVGHAVYNNGGSATTSNGGTAGSAYAYGIVVAAPNGGTVGVTGDRVDVVVWGRVTGFSGATPNDVIYISDTGGRLADAAGTNSHKIGRMRDATTIFVQPPLTEA